MPPWTCGERFPRAPYSALAPLSAITTRDRFGRVVSGRLYGRDPSIRRRLPGRSDRSYRAVRHHDQVWQLTYPGFLG